jgi:hypothetical protein
MDAKSGLHDGVKAEVLALLGRAKAYRELPDAERGTLAASMTKVAAFLADKDWLTEHTPAAGAGADEPPQLDALRGIAKQVDFPGFVASLVQGVFQAIVDASVQQMEAYAELVKEISKTIDEFAESHVSGASTRPAVRQRQQQLATMVLMGIHRIVVTDGDVHASSGTGGRPTKHRP